MKYFEEASSINFRRSVTYGLGVLATSLKYRLEKMGMAHFKMFSAQGRKLESRYHRVPSPELPDRLAEGNPNNL